MVVAVGVSDVEHYVLMKKLQVISLVLWVLSLPYTAAAALPPGEFTGQATRNQPHHLTGIYSLPRLPSDVKGRFGASYTKLKYHPDWDRQWRVSEHPDVVVRFDSYAHQFVFWRGTSYIPCWVTDTGIWYTNEHVERLGGHSPNTEGCVEPMSDKQCRFSHVRVIENNKARVVVHWRYAPIDVHYNHPFRDDSTGWSDWVDEYYTVYPDAVSVRKATLHTTRPDLWAEYQESIVINPPGTVPEDNIELGAVSLANLKGESKVHYWTKAGAPDFGSPKGANILKINLKTKQTPFAIVPPAEDDADMVTPYKGHAPTSCFHFWDHWPVSQDATDGRIATSSDRPSHTSLCHMGLKFLDWERIREQRNQSSPVRWPYHAKGKTWRTKVMLHGMTGKPVASLVPLARSWLYAPELDVHGAGYACKGYDRATRSYGLVNKPPGQPGELTIHMGGSEERPVINPAFVIENWGESGAALTINGKRIQPGPDFRAGHRETLETVDLVVWIRVESTKTVMISLSPIP